MKKALPLLLLVGLLVAFRALAAWQPYALPGFQPISAVIFCTAACVGLRWLWIPFTAWVISYFHTNDILGYLLDWQALVTVLGFTLVVWIGWSLRNHRRALPLLGGTLGAAVVFYFVTNCGSWLLLPDYPKTWAGFVQAQWTGAPHHALDTWVFLRNGMLGNAVFTALFLLGQRQWGAEPRGELAVARLRR